MDPITIDLALFDLDSPDVSRTRLFRSTSWDNLSDPGVCEAVDQRPAKAEVAQPDNLFLPEACVREIAHILVRNETPGNALVNLMAMCGVCQHWRTVAREATSGACVGFDGLDNTFSQVSQPSVQRFRRLPAKKKEEFFISAAKLLTGGFPLCCI